MTMNRFSPIISSSSLPRRSDQSSGHFFTVSKLMWSECFLFHGHLPKQALKKFQHGTDQRAPAQYLGTLCSGFNDAANMMNTLSQNCQSLNSQVCGAWSKPTPSSTPSSNLPFYLQEMMMMMITTHSLTSTHLLICHFIFLEMIIITTFTLISWNRVSEWACCAFFLGGGGLQLTIKNLSSECYTLLCDVLKSASKLHWAGAALSLVVYVLEQVDQGSKNTSECLSLLLAMRDLAKHIRALLPQLPEADEKLKTATSLIAQGTVLCCTHVNSGTFSKYA